MSSGRRWAAAGALAPLLILAAGCGQPTAQLVQAGDSPITFEVPAEYASLSSTQNVGAVYGPPGASAVELGDVPVLFLLTSDGGDTASFQGLRQIATGGQFDPLDPELETLPDNTEILGYEEINDPDVWGVRLSLAVGMGAKDFQALVHRASDQVVITELTCRQACFAEQVELIEQIQGSWSLES